ncbi:aminotransferase class-III [Phlyctema vagabunda]|uniref:Aminotransferase class-III n=1 Tax=Phlyctema vagabunda TaxID=108571 RepID=A0ABR4PYX2_9HELO
MAPSATTEEVVVTPTAALVKTSNGNLAATPSGQPKTRHLFDRHLNKDYPVVERGQGNYLYLEDGRVIFDSTGGAAVSCLGHNFEPVIDAMCAFLKSSGIPYIASPFFSHKVVDEACQEIIRGTDGKLCRVYLTGSGSEAMEATIKLARQYFYEDDKNTTRVNFIARDGSYHGNTLGALSVSGHKGRRAPYLPFLNPNVHHVSACNAYRQKEPGQSDASFVAQKVAELEAMFEELGPDTVIGFIMEPVVGAALGCVPAVPGYMTAMRDVCHRHGALFILDEVMCGMGRTGNLHAWQAEDAVPDIQTVGKGLGAGHQAAAAVLISEKVVDRLRKGTGQFIHGQTYQGMPIQAAAVLAVQSTVREQRLVENVRVQGLYLEERLKSLLNDHPNVGDIRGRGLFWGLEFVKDKVSKTPFDPALGIAQRVHNVAISEPHNLMVYPATGSAGGIMGDHVIISPSYFVTREDIEHIANGVAAAVRQAFKEL